MTIRKQLFISFALILIIVAFIIGVFFYTIYKLNSINSQQNHRYDQLIRVKKLSEFNNSYSWIVLDVITDFDKIQIVKLRIKKANALFKNLNSLKTTIINNSESQEEKKNLLLIFTYFEEMQIMIKDDLYTLVLKKNSDFNVFNKKFENIYINTQKVLALEINYLKNKLTQTQDLRDAFLDTIKLELLVVFVILFLLSFVISSKIISEIKEKLYRLNQGVLQLFKNGEKTIKVDIGENNELYEITKNLVFRIIPACFEIFYPKFFCWTRNSVFPRVKIYRLISAHFRHILAHFRETVCFGDFLSAPQFLES